MPTARACTPSATVPAIREAVPVWSPDGSLIAYSGEPLNTTDPDTSLWVITPDGLNDQRVIPSEGGYEIGVNTNPSWTPDSRSLLTHTVGMGTPRTASRSREETRQATGPTSTSSRDPRGTACQRGRPPGPSSRSSAKSTAPTGSSSSWWPTPTARTSTRCSTRHVALATPCWTPDDRFIRAASLENGTDPRTTLLPLDGTQPVDIPWVGDGQFAGCYPQRLAP